MCHWHIESQIIIRGPSWNAIQLDLHSMRMARWDNQVGVIRVFEQQIKHDPTVLWF